MTAMKTENEPSTLGHVEKITLPEEGISGAKLRWLITIIVTVFIVVLFLYDFFLGFWMHLFYWISLVAGIILGLTILGYVSYWNTRQLEIKGESWLAKWGDEIGWPLMILAFSVQFLLPQLRPFLLGAILAGTWLVLLWQHSQK